jgi:hypothetical protein
MKRVALFIILAVALDFSLGAALHALDRRTFSGDRGGLVNYALTKDADILILGSSRAEYHVMPSVLNQELQGTSYNAGLKGQDLLCAAMLYDLWQRRHPQPQAVVLTIDLESLLPRKTEVAAAAQLMAPYLDESALVREILYSDGPFKRVEYLSRAYRFNGKVLSIAKHLFSPPHPQFDGFAVSEGALDPATDTGVLNALDQDETQMEMAQRPFSPRKVAYLQDLAKAIHDRGGRLFLLHTPLYRQDAAAHRLWMSKLEPITRSLPGVEIIDLGTVNHPEVFAGKPELYRNLNHLNQQGAEVLTRMLAAELKKWLPARIQAPARVLTEPAMPAAPLAPTSGAPLRP